MGRQYKLYLCGQHIPKIAILLFLNTAFILSDQTVDLVSPSVRYYIKRTDPVIQLICTSVVSSA